MMKRKPNAKRGRGRPEGIESCRPDRHPAKFAIAICRGLRWSGTGPYVAAHWASVVTGNEAIKARECRRPADGRWDQRQILQPRRSGHEDDRLVRNADQPPATDWEKISAQAVKALILAVRTGNGPAYFWTLDILIAHGWSDVIEGLRARIDDLAKSNLPPREGGLGQEGKRLLDLLRAAATRQKPK